MTEKLKPQFDAARKRLKKYFVSLALMKPSKRAIPLIYISWNKKYTPPFPDGTGYSQPTFKKPLHYLTGQQMPLSEENIVLAERHAMMFATVLSSGKFKWEDYWFWLPDYLQEQYKQSVKPLTIQETIDNFEQWFWAQRDKRDKSQLRKGECTWSGNYKYRIFSRFPTNSDKPLTKEVVKAIIESTQANTYNRKGTIKSLKTFLAHCGASIDFDFDYYKKSTKYETENKYIPSDEEIDELMRNFPYKKKGKRIFQYRWVLGMMAIYGFRNAEALFIQNLWEPYTYLDKNGKQITLPALMDKSNKEGIIFVSDGKTGKRIQALPLHAEWLDDWGLRDFDNPPTWDNLTCNPKNFIGKMSCHLRNHGTPFTPYAMRHAYAHRAERLKVLPNVAASALGHSLEVHVQTYHSNKTDKEKIALAESILKDVEQVKSREEDLLLQLQEKEWEVRKLKQELEKALAENENLKNQMGSERNLTGSEG